MPLYDARETVDTVRSLPCWDRRCRYFPTVLVTVMGRERVQVDGAERLLFGADSTIKPRSLDWATMAKGEA